MEMDATFTCAYDIAFPNPVHRRHSMLVHRQLCCDGGPLPSETSLLALCHCRILLLEAIAQALRALHVLVDAFHDAALLPRCERLAFEAVDAVVEALLDEVGIHLEALSAR